MFPLHKMGRPHVLLGFTNCDASSRGNSLHKCTIKVTTVLLNQPYFENGSHCKPLTLIIVHLGNKIENWYLDEENVILPIL